MENILLIKQEMDGSFDRLTKKEGLVIKKKKESGFPWDFKLMVYDIFNYLILFC